MPKTTRIRKNIHASSRFTQRLNLDRSPLDTISQTCGLVNTKNMCYINSCLQCLAHCEPFAQVMLHGRHERNTDEFCALCEMKTITADILQAKNEPSDALSFALNSPLLHSDFTIGTQQDSHEFLKKVLDCMITAEKRGCRPLEGGLDQNSEESGHSLVEQVFKFNIKQTVRCSKCRNSSVTQGDHADLSLQITNTEGEEIQSVEEALNYYFREEKLGGDNAYMCNTCNEKTTATRAISLEKGPNVLVISLGRFLVEFDAERRAMVSRKLNHFVKFSIKLDVTPYMHEMSANEELKLGENQYRLSAFSYHVGASTNEGHYVSDVFLPASSADGASKVGEWMMKNDEVVLPIKFNQQAKAYLLFYTREDSQPSALPGPRKKKESKKTGQHRWRNRERSMANEEENTESNDTQGEMNGLKQRVFLFPRIDMPRKKEWSEEEYGSDEEVEVVLRNGAIQWLHSDDGASSDSFL